MGQKLQTVWGDRLFRCVFVSPCFAPWFLFAMPFVARVCSPVRRLLLCLAVLQLLLCSLVLSTRFFTFNGHLSQEPDKSLDSLWVYFTWQSKSVVSSETGRKKEVSIHTENPAACWMERRSFSSMLAPVL